MTAVSTPLCRSGINFSALFMSLLRPDGLPSVRHGKKDIRHSAVRPVFCPESRKNPLLSGGQKRVLCEKLNKRSKNKTRERKSTPNAMYLPCNGQHYIFFKKSSASFRLLKITTCFSIPYFSINSYSLGKESLAKPLIYVSNSGPNSFSIHGIS